MRPGSPSFRMRLGGMALLLASASGAFAGGPRWYTGPPFYTASEGAPVAFFTPDVLYYTDPGDLQANVSHAQADAMVAAAAAVWNVPTARLTLAQGGTLDEHVSSGNTYFDGDKVVWPADAQATNYHSKAIAVVYDADGSVIDMLLGSGASQPSGCRQNAVVESVDGLDPDGTIHHALLLLNGRCVGANADQLQQMRYQLTRAFGRVLGIAWSQLNDNVFTGMPTPTLAQALNWPLMHPIDVICGPYTYKCMAQPFMLRPDDLSALAQVYPVTSANLVAGKTLSSDGALFVFGKLLFPTDQGMDAVNIVVTRQPQFDAPEAAELVSAVSGMAFQQFAGNSVTGAPSGAAQSNGKPYFEAENQFIMARVPLPGTGGYSLHYRTESINPLYTGEYAVGPYVGQPAAMSGPAFTFLDDLQFAGRYSVTVVTASQAANSCNPGNDGTADAPAPVDSSGFLTGLLCGPRHSSWWSHSVQPGRTWTIEATAVDENGVVSTAKAQPLLGVWNAADARGTTPSVALTQSAFNAQALGMTQLHIGASSSPAGYRFTVADARGHGRPDFGYKLRVLYAESVSPAQLGASGGRITITGEGFRTGNRVTINGVAANIVSWTANAIVAIAPTGNAAHLTGSGVADVAVTDASTGGTTVMQAALSYGGSAANSITLVSAPTQIEVGVASASSLVVRVLGPDGVTPAPGAGVRFAVSAGAATFAACGGTPCLLTTDAGGYAQSLLTAGIRGTITLTATEVSSGALAQATVTATDPVRTVALISAPTQLETGTASTLPFAVKVFASDGITPVVGVPVRFTITSGTGAFTQCGAAVCTLTTDASGAVNSTLTASATGAFIFSATELGSGTSVQAAATAVDAARLVTLISAPVQVETGIVSTTAFSVRVVAADGTTPVAGAAVRFAFTAGTGVFTLCGTATCLLTTDASGTVSSALTAGSVGALGFTATEQKSRMSVQATAISTDPARHISLLSSPALLVTGSVSTTAFSIKVVAADGATPVAAATVRFAITSGTGVFASCGAAQCTLTTDAAGIASSTLEATSAGALTFSATDTKSGVSLQATATAADPAWLISLVSAPAQLETGTASAAPFSVKVTAVDGVTPVPGANVRFNLSAGTGAFAACGASACTLTTDANGLARSAITAAAAGTLTLTATELRGGAIVQASASVMDPARQATILNAPRYLAAGASSLWSVTLTATQNGTPATGTSVAWTATAGVFLGTSSGSADALGTTTIAAFTPGLAAGTQAVVQGCVWTNVCAASNVFAVAPTEWTLTVAGGAGQSILASATLSSVTLQVTDSYGHPLEGATVTLYQTVNAWEGLCPSQGRCPAAPVLLSSKTTATSDANGMVAVTPLEAPGIASVVHIAAVTGTQGFVSLALTKTP